MDKSSEFADFSALNLIGQSPNFTRVLKMITQIAASEVAVSIYGETGTGKELIARAIHYLGSRSGQPFIPINCGALPDSLFENEMFGHERGAFTDAKSSQSGLIAQADGGTLFLDEVEALTAKAQATLLRFLQDKQYRTLGGKTLTTADVRIVVASNVDLKRLCDEGSFRADLYYRLNVVPITLPALRERTGDVALLASTFMRRLRVRYEEPAKHLDASALDWVIHHEWPGNIRELENMLHRAFLLAGGDTIKLHHLNIDEIAENDSLQATEKLCELSFNDAKALVISKFETSYLRTLMQQADGNVSHAAVKAGKERRSLGKLLKKCHIDPQEFKHV